jgi:hypothetical protein
MPKPKKFNLQFLPLFVTTNTMRVSSEKEDILRSNALAAYGLGQFKSIQAAASHFRVSKHKLRNRKAGPPAKKGRTATNKVLNQLQEASIIRWIESLVNG